MFVGRYPHVQRQPSVHKILHSFTISTHFPSPIIPHRLLHRDGHRSHLLSMGHYQRLRELRTRGKVLEQGIARHLSQFRSRLVLQCINEHLNRRRPPYPAHATPFATAASPHAKGRSDGRFRYRYPGRGH